MKISFLIPTKNRVELLRSAISSILAQREIDLEIVVSDNASEQDYKSLIDHLDDPRIIYHRLSEPVSVTKNWQNAVALSSGDYILMLGDDDALAPRFGEILKPVLADTPDAIYLSAYHYAYPNTLDFKPSGYLAIVRNSEFMTKDVDTFCLTKGYARELAGSVFDFRYRFGFNAQYFLLRSSFVKKFDEHGGLYQSPYPDTFSAIVVLSHAQSIVVVPTETVIIGISPKSFGAYYFSNRQEEGLRFLQTSKEETELRRAFDHVILPGDQNNTNWLIAAEAAKRLIPPSLEGNTNIVRYRTLQMIAALRERYLTQRISDQELNGLRSKLSAGEALLFELLEITIKMTSKIDRASLYEIFTSVDQALGQFVKAKVKYIDIGPHRTIDDAISWLAKNPEVSLDDTERDTIVAKGGGLKSSLRSAHRLWRRLRRSLYERMLAGRTK